MSTSAAHAAASVPDGLPARQRFEAMLAILLAVGVATLDTAIANTALPTISASIGTDSATVIWVVNAYQYAMIAALLPLASAADTIGHRRMYLGGIVVFSVASLGCGLAWSLPTLALARVFQGIGAAALMGVNAALIRAIYPKARLGQGLGTNALVVGLAFTVGPTVTSAILSVATWRWLFLVNVPIGLVAVAIGSRTLPRPPRGQHAFDRLAAVWCAALFGLAILALGTVSHDGRPAVAVAEGVAALGFGALLLRRQAAHPAPMLAVDLFRIPLFALSALTSVCAFAAQGFAFVALPFLIQDVMHHSAVQTGLLITPWPALVALLAVVAGRLSDIYPPGLLGGAGLLALALGMAALALMPADATPADIAWRMMISGAGFGFFQAPNLKAMMTTAPAHRAGGASGMIATCRLLGQSFGASLVALCFHLFHARGSVVALWLGAGFALCGALASGARLLPGARRVSERMLGS